MIFTSSAPFFELSLLQTLIFGSLFGLILGSFLSMLTWRLPRLLMGQYQYELNQSSQDHNAQKDNLSAVDSFDYNPKQSIIAQLSIGGSRCPKCQTRLRWYQLLPLFSWLGSGGKCLNCKNPISKRYPLIELYSAISTVLILWQFEASGIGLAALAFNYLMITISVIDLEHHLILDTLSYPLLWLGLLINTQGWFVSLEQAVWGAIMGYLLLWLVYHSFKLITGKEGIGYGDFKMLAALGAWFGVLAIPQIILIAAISSIAIAVIGILLKRHAYEQPLAFGPFLAIGGWSTLFLGNSIF